MTTNAEVKTIEGLPALDPDKGIKSKASLVHCPNCNSKSVGGYEGAECNDTWWWVPQECNVCGATWDIILGAIGVANFRVLGDDDDDDEEYTPTCTYGTETNPCNTPTDLFDDGGQPICQKHADEVRRATRIVFQNFLEANE